MHKLLTNWTVPNVELSPLCSPKFNPGAPSEKAQSVSEFIHQLFVKSQVFPLADLCIEEGKAVWVLYADIVCLNYDGNILDASLLALTTALKDCKFFFFLGCHLMWGLNSITNSEIT